MRRPKDDDLDDFINGELNAIDPSKVQAKPQASKPFSKPITSSGGKNTFAKPSFMSGKKKIQVKSLRPAVNKQDDFIDSELNNIQQPNDQSNNLNVAYQNNNEQEDSISPNRVNQMQYDNDDQQLHTTPVIPPSQSRIDMLKQAKLDKTPPVQNFQMQSSQQQQPTPVTSSISSKPKMMSKAFIKPKTIQKKKFQMSEAPVDENMQKLLANVNKTTGGDNQQDIIAQQSAKTSVHIPKGLKEFSKRPISKGVNQSGVYGNNPNTQGSSTALNQPGLKNQSSAASFKEVDKKVNDSFAAPRMLIEKTKQAAAFQKANPRPPSNAATNKKSALDDSDDYEENDFDEDDGNDNEEDQLSKLRKAMAKENKKAQKVVENSAARGTSSASKSQPRRPMAGPIVKNKNLVNQYDMGPSYDPNSLVHPATSNQHNEAPRSNSYEPPRKNLEGFGKQKAMFVGEKIDHQAANQQEVRAEELRELVELTQEEFFNVFEIVPQTSQDIYFNKLTAGTIKTAVVSSMDEYVEKEMQTEDAPMEDKFNQAPDDIMTNYKQIKSKQGGIQQYTRKKKRQDEALNLEKFMSKAGPVMEQVIEENEQLSFLNTRDKAAKRNAVEMKQNLKFPEELLILLEHEGTKANLKKITCIHMFENSPQSKCAVSYMVSRANGDDLYLIILYSISANQILRIMRCESEVTQMCTPGEDNILIVGTTVGSLYLFDLSELEVSSISGENLNFNALLQKINPGIFEQGETNIQNELRDLQIKYTILSHTFQTDVLPNQQHFSPITRLKFVSKLGGSPAQIGAMDELGVVSSWSVMEISTHLADKIGDYDLNLNIGGRFKLLENFSENLMFMPEIMDSMDAYKDIAQSMELEFDPTDNNVFYFSTSESLFKCDRRISKVPTKLETTGLGAPSALSMSDKSYLLAGFTCGSIALYNKAYSSPITVWYQACQFPIIQLKWCLLFFNEDGKSSNKANNKDDQSTTIASNNKFTTRLCEFFAIDKNEDFLIWNLQKSLDKPAHVIHFAEKHRTLRDYRLYRISMTCADQSFFTAFAQDDLSVNMYLMNFKKGSQITKEKLNLENRKSYKILTTLPLNMVQYEQNE